jgi:hypothetical protein
MLVALEIGIVNLCADQKDVGFVVGDAQRYDSILLNLCLAHACYDLFHTK